MKAVFFLTFFCVSSVVFSQTIGRCPEEWHGRILCADKSKSDIYHVVLKWIITKIDKSEPLNADEYLGAIKAQTKLPYQFGVVTKNRGKNISDNIYYLKSLLSGKKNKKGWPVKTNP